ncbi:CDP-diacylglycerol--serine O-phosphatidyltransferase [Cereibacter sphaeroides]|uniref:CDP-diacylglycerol--serine O-phosphatidyltransferase n=1 Tax=Rhodobacterales TaxID=204455 RepID=UPI000BBF0D2D|nr:MULTISPECIES: CDP-diacylglycerol--serine O-phosphatidyltransferase [Paracoccaceae]MCE6950507.1 CDP-diacylglycerol--serine O-phosphatidyltransferase [Cereibacter sphaeroides]MCE6959460.1 CDP-diacylglycerol--serine O-phosphatidyltransferase [Cereibacter sphaeroides]MCE6968267.1 CDP-diacylglycerol--serine O-phosphatidyltransferase [Cereibacter sphaeroides]MCE6973769.1 CDP-diacylglycerol--serine O-phosphatidyltransferase [Cereibacter sphaeroides]
MLRRDERTLPLLMLLPNLVTITGLCAGLTAIRFIMVGRFDIAAMLIIFAAAIDGLDGLIARRLNAQSEFGAELDSLSDFLNFGVAPGLLVYQYALAGTYSTNWVFVLVYTLCGCLRLARFNVNRDQPLPPGAKPHFTGVPAPGGALLALLPIFMSLQGLVDASAFPMAYGVYLALVGLLMTSRIPTISPKAMRIPRDKTIFVLIGTVIVLGLLVTRFWLLMVLVGLAYAAVTAMSIGNYLRRWRS